MRLQSLRIKGFKSFANDTLIPFEQNQIGIVGPNGSGKSNIVDAIRWVLGEQKSKELRLNKMSDVLFNGTKSRKAAGVAQVTLTFENTKNILPVEYNTVSVSRLLYRNGDSEYRLNNVTCRRKDITNLFIDSGIGSNSYAIIELGMVDNILQNKNNARRKMFEQGAGIAKYKVRKHETELKLKSTQADLERLQDIIFELENNMRSLERQAKRAKKYFEFKEEYKSKSLIFTRFQIKDLEEKYKSSKTEISLLEEKYAKDKAGLSSFEAELEKYKKDNLEKELIVSEKQKEINVLFDKIRQSENDKNINIEKINFNKNSFDSLSKSIESRIQKETELQAEVNHKTEEYNKLQETATSIHTAFEEAKSQYDLLKSQYDIVKNDFEKNKIDLLQLEEKSNELEKELAIEENSVSTMNKSLAFISETSSALEPKLLQLSTVLAEIEKKIQLESEKENQLLQKIEDAQSEEKMLREQLENSKQELSDENRKLDKLQSEEGLLKNMIENLEGFPASIKYLKKNYNKSLTMLADIIDCEESYRVPLEQFLEPYINHFVVDNMDDAYQGLTLLKSSQRGKANFLILDEVDNASISQDTIPSDWIRMSNIVKVDAKYRKLVDHICRNVFIVPENAFAGTSLSGTKDKIFISTSGTVIKKANEMRGGSLGLFEGKKLGRKQRLEELRKLIKEKELQISSIIEKNEKLSHAIDAISIETIRAELSQLQLGLGANRRERVKLETEVSLQNQSFQEQRSQEVELTNNLGLAKNKIEDYKTQLIHLKEQKDQIRNMPDKSEDEINDLELRLTQSSDNFNEMQIKHIRQQGLEQNTKTEIDFIQKQIEENSINRDQEQHKLEEHKQVLTQAKEVLVGLERLLIEQYSEKEEKEKSLNSEEQEYYSVRNKIAEKEENIRESNRVLQKMQIDINVLKEKHHSYQLDMNSAGERMKIEFNLSLDELLNSNEVIDEDIDYDEMGARVAKLRHKLQNFGEVNPMAVTAYDETKKRHDEIIEQREDIIQAKGSLLETIAEIELDATDKFKAAFDEINMNFKRVFRSLFSDDDDCDLVLLNPDSPLESEIEVIAKPKGKRPKSLSQLSGGEKTLTATALLFSLYLLKPAPFCIFDEVDAPLDDANVIKFSKLINTFSEESQFILITHNKATMAAVDVLYGVFMQEQGVSAISPVDFRSYEYSPLLKVVNN